VSFHFLVRFDPPRERSAEFRTALLAVTDAARAEPGCIEIHAFESVREPREFAIHSEWVDETSFEVHGGLAHTVLFIASAEKLLGRPVQGLRVREIGGGGGGAGGRGLR